MKASVLLIAAGLALGTLAPAWAQDGVVREGVGARRDQLNAMELKPFDHSLWSTLSEWTGGDALTPAKTDGKVVVIYTWASWLPTSARANAAAERIARRHAGEVIVVGAHPAEGWEDARKAFDTSSGVILARDAAREFRAGLHVDQDPDFYVIDRAGQLRFADIETPSVDAAVSQLIGETAEQASKLPSKLAAAEAARRVEARRTHEINPGLIRAMSGDVPLVFDLPDAAAYAGVKWPEKNTGSLNATDVQGQGIPGVLGGGIIADPNWKWIGRRPDVNGRVIVLDFWAVWCGPCKAAMPGLDALQRANKDTLAILGVSGQGEPEATVRNYLSRHKSAYYHAYDPNQTIYKALFVNAIPHVVVISTDGVVRWQGNPLDKQFGAAVNAVLAGDPGVKARKDALARHIEELERTSGG